MIILQWILVNRVRLCALDSSQEGEHMVIHMGSLNGCTFIYQLSDSVFQGLRGMTILCIFLITAFYYIQRYSVLLIRGLTMGSRKKNSYSLGYSGNKWNLDVSSLFTILKIMWLTIRMKVSLCWVGFCDVLNYTRHLIVMKLFKETFRDNHKTAPVCVMNSPHQWKFCYVPVYNLSKCYFILWRVWWYALQMLTEYVGWLDLLTLRYTRTLNYT
jgi:hypothetical protein